MYSAKDFEKAIADYMQFNREINEQASGAGTGLLRLFGFRTGPAFDPGHEKFFKEIKSALEAVCRENPDPEEAKEIMDTILGAREIYAEEPVSPYMFAAIEGLTKDLAAFLSPETAASIYRDYEAKNPKRMRAPVQKDLLLALKKAAGLS